MTDKASNMQKIFYPESIAIVGANKVPGTVPNDIVMNILKTDFQGIVFPVSPGENHIAGIKAYKYVKDIEDPVDLAILVFPSSVCHLALEQCGQKGIKAVIIISAGFKEVGGKGLERERQLKDIAAKYGMSFIGPNCLGVINTDPIVKLNASFARKMPEEGSIGFLSQSGALCTAVLDYAISKHIGFSKFVSFGNKADISEIDLLFYLRDDPKTKVILLYLEEITNGRALMDAARNVIETSGKPILAIKSGRTSAGASAASSHTGSLAGSDEICDAAMKQAGIIRCENIEEMFNKAIALTYQPMPENNRVAIVTNAGGPGVLTTDAAINQGLKMAEFSEETSMILKRALPKTANTKNPVDVIGDARADRYDVAVSAVEKDKGVDGVFVILTPQSMTEIEDIAKKIVEVSSQHDKPIYTSFMGEHDVATGVDILQRNKIPHYILPESMAKSFATAYEFRNRIAISEEPPALKYPVDKEKASAILDKALADGHEYLPEYEAEQVLKAYGLPVMESHLVNSAADAVKAAEKIGFPVVMKAMSEDIVHKFDIGGVVLNIKDKQAATAAYQTIIENVADHAPDAKLDGVMVTPMVRNGQEVILGVKRDPAFDSVIMFGLGGIFVEIFRDVSFRIAPFNRKQAAAMINDIKGIKILKGARGMTPKDVNSIIDALMQLSALAQDCKQIKELDINPLLVLDEGKGCYVADAKIMLK